MGKIHVLLKKEELNKSKSLENKIVVVFDILLATTSITTALAHGAKEVIPVSNKKEALEEVETRKEGSYELVGEYNGLTIEGFLSPDPTSLIDSVKGKSMILSTTNGTVALKNAIHSKKTFATSLLNSTAVVNKLLEDYKNETIILVCSGSGGEFNVEDFYGAGYFIDCLNYQSNLNWKITDAALGAYEFYKGSKDHVKDLFKSSRTGKMIIEHGMAEAVEIATNTDIYHIVPYVRDNRYLAID